MSGDEAFFTPLDEDFQATELTRGPWDPDSQHAGPPAGLIGREIERLAATQGDWQVGRITFEILGPIPIDALRVEARVIRPGNRVQLVEAELRDSEEVLVRARAWLVRKAELELPPHISSLGEGSPARRAGRPTGALGPPPGPPKAADSDYFPMAEELGYHSAMEFRFTEGSFLELGPATTWMRMLYPLVAGEKPTPLQRVLTAVDSGSGVSATLDFTRYLFVNVDLSVHLHRMPVGEWVCLDSISVPEPAGVGLSDTALYDERGPIGRALQTLLIAEREK